MANSVFAWLNGLSVVTAILLTVFLLVGVAVCWALLRAAARAAARLARLRLPVGVRKNGIYLAVVVLAISGQTTIAVERLHLAGLAIAAAAAIAVGIEGVAVRVSYLALQRSRLGEQAKGYWVASAVMAAVAVSINVIGHTTWYGRAAFGLFSAAGYVLWLLDARTQLRDAWDADGAIRTRVPAFGLLKQYESDTAVIDRARLIAQIHAETDHDAPGLGPLVALRMARAELVEEHRRDLITAGIRRRALAVGMNEIDIEIALLSYDNREVAGAIIAGADNAGLAAMLGMAIQPERFAAAPVPAPEPIGPEPEQNQNHADAGSGAVDVLPPLDEAEIAEFMRQLGLAPTYEKPGSPAGTKEPDRQESPVQKPVVQKVRGLTGTKSVELEPELVAAGIRAAAELAAAGTKLTRRSLESQLRTNSVPISATKANALLTYLREVEPSS